MLGSEKKESASSGILIIGHKDVPVDTLSRNDIKMIFKGERALWPDNQPITFVLLTAEPIHSVFVKHYIRKTPEQYTRLWKKIVFSGRGFSPPAFESTDKILRFIKKTPGSIGFAPAGITLDSVKSIKVRYE